jgi:protocatechuate 3,4-dioxygenase beta subunit
VDFYPLGTGHLEIEFASIFTEAAQATMPPFAALLLAAAVAQTPAEPLRVTGQVQLPAGIRVDTVRIELDPALEEYSAALARLRGVNPRPAPLATTRPRPDGSYELLAPGSGFYRITVRAGACGAEASLAPLLEEVELPPAEMHCASPSRSVPAFERWMAAGFGGENTFLWSPLASGPGTSAAPGKSALLAVRDARGEPVAGALVRPADIEPPDPLGVTGTDGRFPIAIPLRGWHPRLAVEGPGGARAAVSLGPSLVPGGVVPVVLRPPEEVAGRVVRAGGGPVAGALVWNGARPSSPPVRTGADGRFRLAVPAGAAVELGAAAAGFLPLRQNVARRAGSPVATTLELRPAAALSGLVVDARGRPVPGALVLAPRSNRQALSRADGRFRLTRLLPRGSYELTVQKEGFPRTTAAARTGAAGREVPPLRIVLGEGQRIRGKVLDREGRPIAAELTLAAEEYGGGEPERSVTSADAQGAFELRDLSPGRFELRAVARGFAPARRTGIEVGAGPEVVELGTVTLEPGTAIEGVVTDSAGSPVAGAEVIARSNEPVRSWFQEPEPPSPYLTGTDGRFRIVDLRRGDHVDLEIHHPAYAPAQALAVEVPTPEPLHVELKPARSLAGRVLGPRGEPVPGALLSRIEELRIGGGSQGSAFTLGQTGADGTFRVTGLAPGTLNLEVSAGGYRTRRTGGVQIPEDRDIEHFEVTLEPGVILAGRVLDSLGEPVGDASIWVHPERPPRDMMFRRPGPTRTDGEGRWQVDGLDPGAVRVDASHQRGRATARLLLAPGENHLDLTLPAGVEVAGRVGDEAGAPLPNVILRLVATEGMAGSSVASEADGTFVFPNVADGSFTLKASLRGYEEAAYPGEVRIAGQPVSGLDLHLSRSHPATIRGQLLGLGPDDLAGVRISARMEESYLVGSGVVEPGGRYHVGDVAAGEWTVEAHDGADNSAAGRVQIEPGASEAVLDLTFRSGLTLSGRILVDGRPLAGAEVLVGSLSPATGRPDAGHGRTAYDGSFAVRHLEAGPHELLVVGSGDGFGYAQPVDIAAERAVEIQVTTGSVRGHVLGNGGPIAGADVSLEGQDAALGSYSGPTATTDDQGSFELSAVGPGTYRVTVQKAGVAPAAATLVVRPGEAAAIEMDLSPAPVR